MNETSQTHGLYAELNKRGHFPLVVIRSDDLTAHFEEEGKPITNEKAQKACQILYDNWTGGDEYMSALAWAADLINEERV
jgi:hypothetical protein